MNKLIKNELGQAMVEYALTIIMFIFVLFSIIDLGWIGFQYISFDYSYQYSSWVVNVNDTNIDLNRNYYGYYYDNLIKTNILDNAVGIKSSNLDVYYTNINLTTKVSTVINPDKTKSTNKRRYMRITSVIEYTIKPLTPIGEMLYGSEIKWTKNLDRLRLLQLKT